MLLSDMAFGGADTLATSKVLAEAIRKLNQQDAGGPDHLRPADDRRRHGPGGAGHRAAGWASRN